MTLHPDEQARELHKLADEWLYGQARSMRFSNDFTPQQVPSLAALLARVKLAEAEWWHFQEVGAHDCEAVIETAIEHIYPDWPRGLQDCQRLAKLRQAAGEGTKP